jgi:hypothetical protein
MKRIISARTISCTVWHISAITAAKAIAAKRASLGWQAEEKRSRTEKATQDKRIIRFHNKVDEVEE